MLQSCKKEDVKVQEVVGNVKLLIYVEQKFWYLPQSSENLEFCDLNIKTAIMVRGSKKY